MSHSNRRRPAVAAFAALALVVDPPMPVVMAAQTAARKAAPAGQAAPKAAGAQTPVAPPVDGGWPRYYGLPSGGSILMYQPQIAGWDRQTHMVPFTPVSYPSTTPPKPPPAP